MEREAVGGRASALPSVCMCQVLSQAGNTGVNKMDTDPAISTGQGRQQEASKQRCMRMS